MWAAVKIKRTEHIAIAVDNVAAMLHDKIGLEGEYAEDGRGGALNGRRTLGRAA